MDKRYAGLDARLWNRMFHAAKDRYYTYRTLAAVEALVIAGLVAIVMFK